MNSASVLYGTSLSGTETLAKQEVDLESRVQPLLKLLNTATGLDEDQARTLVYFAIATRAVDRLNKFPMMKWTFIDGRWRFTDYSDSKNCE